MLSAAEYSRYSRHLLLDNFDEQAQTRLSQAKVVLFGVGGLGCQVASSLVSAGLGELVLIDDDNVELSNLPRQWLFAESDIGIKKAHAARARLTAMHAAVTLRCITDYADTASRDAHLASSQLIIDCTDSVTSRLAINSLAMEHRMPLVSAAASGFIATASAFFPSETGPCYACPEYNSEQSQTCLEQGIFSPVVAIAGQLQASMTLSYLSGMQTPEWGALHHFNGQSLLMRRFSIQQNPDCPACAKHRRRSSHEH